MPPVLRVAFATALFCLPLRAQEAAPAASPAPTTVAPAAPAEAKEDVTPTLEPRALEAVRKGFVAQQEKKTFRIKMKINSPAGSGGDMEMEVVFPDRVRMKGAGIDLVMVGEKAMVKMGEKWIPAPPEFAKAGANAADPKLVEQLIKNCRSARYLGSEKVNGEACEVFEYVVKRKDGTSKNKFFFGPDSLPRRLEVEAEIKKGVAVKSIMDYSDYGAPLSIELPAAN
ncbi:MAG: hypothetical protein JSR82_16855 [Verrucomicrobia bacterium]|nr:hypothetical protein [Verrucomicrobiota bacterium]